MGRSPSLHQAVENQSYRQEYGISRGNLGIYLIRHWLVGLELVRENHKLYRGTILDWVAVKELN